MRHHDVLYRIRQAAETGQKRLDLSSMGLETLPPELAGLQDLETLDLGGNALTGLPDFLADLPGLRRLFVTKNQITHWPEVAGHLPRLELLSFKSNQLSRLPETGGLPASLHWLILTDNQLTALPRDFGLAVPGMRKLALACNRLTSLPESFGRLEQLELLRLGMNRLDHRPPMLAKLPRLAWLGLGGNPWCATLPALQAARRQREQWRLDPAGLVLEELLGSGASGEVFRARLAGSQPGPDGDWAVKCFKPLSSDGRPEDELDVAMAVAMGPQPPGIVPCRGWFSRSEHARESLGMVMDFVPDARPLGLVPSLDSVTRDCYPAGATWDGSTVRRLLASLVRAQAHLIDRKVIHGDFYAHNVLVDAQGEARLGDWGASFFMGEGDEWMERTEVRAFGCLMEELLERCPEPQPDLAALRDLCLAPEPARRPDFATIAARLAE